MGETIFISYRRGEDAGFAGRLYDRLELALQEHRLFMDVDDIAPGDDFVAVLNAKVAESAVLLALIGRTWLTAVDARGQCRLDNPEDFVRIEIGAALAQGKRVIPVLIDDVVMPRADQLPDDLKPLARRHASRLSHERFKVDSDRLIRALQPLLATAASPSPQPKNGVHIGVDPRHLPDLAVFKDIDAPWCPEIVVIPAGKFLMGSPDTEKERYNWEGPQHEVTISARFGIGRYPVTFEEFDQFCVKTGREKPADKGWGRGRRPVISVSWQDAVAYVEWLSKTTGQHYRLPSEAEWEYACRAGTTTRYAFGDAIGGRDANFGGKVGKTTEVGAYPANAWGLHDMHGNVWEWVEDIWHDTYTDAPTDGSAWTGDEGNDSSRYRVGRGGSWINDPRVLRSAIRNRDDPGIRSSSLGFRVARTLS